jgi:peptidoglycan pentaglycine glycine transferase (the first glycine)
MDVTREQWNAFVARQSRARFLQSWEWGEFQASLGRHVERLVIAEQDGHIASAAQGIWRRMPFGSTLGYVPYGPVGSVEFVPAFFEKMVQRSLELKSMALRLDPPAEVKITEAEKEKFQLRPTTSVQPHDTLLLDLKKSEEELKAGMHPKTRYNISLAERKGVTCRWSTPQSENADLELFITLLKETDKRDGIHSFPASYYQAMAAALGRDMFRFAIAEYNGKPLAVNAMVFFGDTVTYNHGASSSQDRNVMAPHLLQWIAIMKAKELGYHWYDFRGLAPAGASDTHRWAGFTRFKLGFGGERVTTSGTFDRVLQPMTYSLYQLTLKLLRR